MTLRVAKEASTSPDGSACTNYGEVLPPRYPNEQDEDEEGEEEVDEEEEDLDDEQAVMREPDED